MSAEMSQAEKVEQILATHDTRTGTVYPGVMRRREKVLIDEVLRLREALGAASSAEAPLIVRTQDHPEAGGRRAQPGERQWALLFTLDDGRLLRVAIGKVAHGAFRAMLIQEMVDNEFDEGGTSQIVVCG